MTKPYTVPNNVSGVLTSSYVHGTDNHLHLVAIGLFATGGGYVRVYTTDKLHWADLEYTGVSTNDLTGLALCTGGNVESDAAYTFPEGSIVARVAMGEDVSSRIMGPASALDGAMLVADGTTGKKAKDGGIPLRRFNVKSYGAVGDGASNDRVAIQAAMDAAAVSGGVVYFPRSTGDYVVTPTGAKVPALALTSKSNVWFEGDGEQNSILKLGGAQVNTNIMEFKGCNRIGFRNLGFNLAKIGTPDNGHWGRCINFIGSDGAGGNPGSASELRVEDCYFTGGMFGGVQVNGNVSRIWILNNRFYDLGNNAIQIHWGYMDEDGNQDDSTSQPSDAVVSGNICNTIELGIWFSGANRVRCTNNTVVDTTEWGGITYYCGDVALESSDCLIEGNVVRGAGTYRGLITVRGNCKRVRVLGNTVVYTGAGSSMGISVAVHAYSGTDYYPDEVTIIGNQILMDGKGDDGIYADATALICTGNYIEHAPGCGIKTAYTAVTNAVIADNQIVDCHEDGIQFAGTASQITGNVIVDIGQGADNTYFGINLSRGAASYNVVSGNNVRCPTGATEYKYPIEEAASGDYNVIVGNFCQDGATSGIHIVGANTEIGHNVSIAV